MRPAVVLYCSKAKQKSTSHLAVMQIGKVNTCIKCMSGWILPTFFFCFGKKGLVLLFLLWRCFIISSKEMLINDEIREKEVRLIDMDGSQLGILPIADAMAKAENKGLDLVLIAPQAKPPACKIMDYGKYKFEQSKRDKEARKNQKTVNIKEVRITPSIDVHDFNTKVNQAVKFLKSGDKVKVTVRFRGRELHHTDLGMELLKKFGEVITESGSIEKAAKLEGRNMTMVVAPKQ